MEKQTAINLLGGTATSAAKAIGITPQAVSMWPDKLSAATRDRVEAALARAKIKRPYRKDSAKTKSFNVIV